MVPVAAEHQNRTLFGHPTGLFTLFFAEMWERFSFYGMRALLLLYMLKGFLQFSDSKAYAIYGAYGTLVYAAPFIGGLLADRVLGPRRAVILGGLLMAGGHLLMAVQHQAAFFLALALLISGNGFFKPNISTIVGELYPQGSPKKDAGFTIFYMGINLGAALSPMLCAYLAHRYGWEAGFGLATAGMLIGVAIFAAPTRLTQILIFIGALGGCVLLPLSSGSPVQMAFRIFLTIVLAGAGTTAIVALGRGGLSKQVGRARDPERLRVRLGGVLRLDVSVYLIVLACVPLIAGLLYYTHVIKWVLYPAGAVAVVYVFHQAVRCDPIDRHRLFVIMILLVFSTLFWAFFEQAGSSVNNFTDRNVDRVLEARTVSAADVGTTLRFRIAPAPSDPEVARLPLLTQEQLGYELSGQPFTLTHLERLRSEATSSSQSSDRVLDWPVDESHIGMGVGGAEIPTAEFQAVNPLFILLFGLAFTSLWVFLGKRGLEPSTPVKFSLGLLQLALGFTLMWYGARHASDRGMVGVVWLILGYLFQTTGELCISPVGLSMVTNLSPRRMVSTMMGVWFLGSAFSHFLGGQIAKLTAFVHEGEGTLTVPPPAQTLNLYADVFGLIAIAAFVCALICLALSPLLTRWMHLDLAGEPAQAA